MLSTTKQVKLLVHQKTFSVQKYATIVHILGLPLSEIGSPLGLPKKKEDELVLNPKEFPNAKVGDIVEIYHPEDDYSRLLLQVKSLKENKQQATKESVSVDQSIAAAFNLRTYKDVIVNIVNPDDVTLDLLELTFKDQYISRSDMWRLKTSLLNSCAYITRKVEFSGIRAQISELWSKGVKVACGNISEDTKVVFRSSTAMVYLFIQMSCEMWEFDVYGDLHLEKAIEFLTELFTSWKEGNTYHDLNIVLFSRTYYTANTIDEFPVSVRDCLQQDYKGRFYEDFYRIVAIGERRDDWRPILVNMKKVFNEYQSKVIRTKVEGEPCPNGYNSTSVQGNFLEAINMSLNVFDKHFVNRNFDRTGQLAILITPGAGVFEVDRELCNITKQRMIDNGIGSDLVCMAEQPLHAAPLFKFHNKMGYTNIGDDYNIPYWINHSFYTSKDQQQKQRLMPANFIPRIKLAETPTTESNQAIDDSLFEPGRDSYMDKSNTELPDVVIDHNAYDAQVFKLPSHIKQGVKSQYLTPKRYEKYADRIRKSDGLSRKVSLELRPVSPEVEVPYTKSYSTNAMEIPNPRPRSNTVTGTNKKSLEGAIGITSKSFQIATSQEMEDNLPTRLIVGSASMVTDHQPGKPWPYGQRMQRALINPFAPSQIIDRLTSNKRRWTHTFPLGPTGKAIQAHHQLTVTLLDDFNNEPYSLSPPTREVTAAESAVVEARKKASVNVRLGDSDSYSASGFHSSASSSSLASTSSQRSTSVDSFKTVQSIGSVINTYDIDYRGRSDTLPSHHTPLHGGQGGSFKNATEGWYWGVTGEQEWSPLIQTGVDWKSVTWPACLPITTDYFPDKVVMSKMYVESPYDLLADEVAIGNKKLTTEQVFKEIVSQRLMQGCQLIVQPQSQNRTYSAGNILQTQEVPDYLLSIGRNYHKINLTDVNINVVRYRPRHIYQTSTVKYTYRLWPVDNSQYEPAYVTFDTEKLEEFNWNYLDNYVCTCEDYGLMDSLKYWRSRFLLLPSNSAATKKINDGSSDRCDIYTTDETKPPQQILEGFYKFVEVLNRIKKLQKKVNQTPSRPPSRRASSVMLSNLSQTPTDREMSQTPKQSGFGGIIATSSNDIATVTMSYTDGSMPTGDGAANTSTASLDKDDKGKEEEKLNLDSPLADIIKAMKDPGIGMTFLPTDQRLLPENCFISGEAVHWLIQTLQDEVTEYQAVQLFQAMVDEERVCHASCLPKRKIPFKNGFFLYFITPDSEDSSKSDWQYRRYTAFGSFDRDWFEVAVDNNQPLLSEPPDNILSSSPIQWRTLQLKEQPKGSEIPTFGEVIYDVDINNKSDRVEWCHIRYHKTYRTDSAFELEVQWLVATGCLIMDMVQSWARKAGSCGFHLIPATIDPFGLNTQYSDPLRRPLFIDLECAELLRNCPQQVEMERVKFFQQEILKTFGFVQDPWAISSFGITAEDIQQFVHTTGSAFAVIPKHHGVPDKTKIRIFTPVHGDESKQHPFCKTTRTGFYWMHNFMLTKRWRSASTGDERFSEKLLTDFKQFCANKDGRLKALWDHVSSGWSV